MRHYATALLLGALLGCSDSNNPSAIGVTLSTTSTLESAGNLTITAELSRASDNDLELSYQTVDGTALAGSDYTATNGTVSLAAGELQTTINIPLIDDDTYECAETFSVTVSGLPSGEVSETFSILNDDQGGPTIQFSETTSDVVENAGTASIEVSSSSPLCDDTTITLSATHLTSNDDDIGAERTVNIPADSSTANFSLTIVDDANAEDKEYLNLSIQSSSDEFLTLDGGTHQLGIEPVIEKLQATEITICAITEDGLGKCWGDGNAYVFANGIGDYITDDEADTLNGVPSAQLGDTPIVDMKVGENLGCALYEDQTFKCWGKKTFVGLDDLTSDASDHVGDTAEELGNNLPTINFGSGRHVTDFSVGTAHACVILDNGRLKCWGRGLDGRLGYEDIAQRGNENGEMGDALPYVNLGTDTGGNPYTVKKVVAGYNVTCAILNNDQLKCWGDNSASQLGYGDFEDRGDEADEMGNNLPFVDLGTNRTVKEVFAYYEHTCVILDNDSFKCWGTNDDGEIGIATGDEVVGNNTVERYKSLCHAEAEDATFNTTPVNVGDANCPNGGFFTEALGFSSVDNYQTASTSNRYACHAHDINYVFASAETFTSNEDCLYGGINIYGDFDNDGDGVINETDESAMGDNLPSIDFGSASPVIDVMLGDDHTCALLEDYTLKCWGDNNEAQSGLDITDEYGNEPNETPANRASPDLGTGLYATTIAGAYYFNCALLNNNRVKCWGYDNDYANLGQPEYLDETIGDGTAKDEGGSDISVTEMGDNLKTVPLFAVPPVSEI